MAFVAQVCMPFPLAIVEVHGELDLHTVRHVERAVEQAVEQGCTTVAVELGGVPFVDCAALGALIAAEQSVRAAGAELVVAGASPQVRRLLELTGTTWLLGALSAASA